MRLLQAVRLAEVWRCPPVSASYYDGGESEPEDLESDVDSGMDFYTHDGDHVFYDVNNPMAWIQIDSDVVLDVEGGELP